MTLNWYVRCRLAVGNTAHTRVQEDLQRNPLKLEPKDDRPVTASDPPVGSPGQVSPAPPPAPQIGTPSVPSDPIVPRDVDLPKKAGESTTRQVRLLFISNYSISHGIVGCYQDESTGLSNNIQRVKIEPERTGWAKLYDLVRQFDKDRVEDIRDDIDTLLVFVSSCVLHSNFLTYSP